MLCGVKKPNQTHQKGEPLLNDAVYCSKLHSRSGGGVAPFRGVAQAVALPQEKAGCAGFVSAPCSRGPALVRGAARCGSSESCARQREPQPRATGAQPPCSPGQAGDTHRGRGAPQSDLIVFLFYSPPPHPPNFFLPSNRVWFGLFSFVLFGLFYFGLFVLFYFVLLCFILFHFVAMTKSSQSTLEEEKAPLQRILVWRRRCSKGEPWRGSERPVAETAVSLNQCNTFGQEKSQTQKKTNVS